MTSWCSAIRRPICSPVRSVTTICVAVAARPRAPARTGGRRACARPGRRRARRPPRRGHDLCHRRLRDAAALGDHDHVVGGLAHLGQHVAGDEHRAALPGQPAQEVAQPADALRVQAVGGLVEDQHPRIAEQRGRQAEPLAHAERVAARAPVGRAESATSSSSSSTRASAIPAASRERRAGGCGRCGPDAASRRRARRRRCAPGLGASRTAGRARSRCRPSGSRARAASAAWSSYRRRWGRGSRPRGPRPP